MEIPTYLLLLLGCLGAADILIYHSVAHGIRSHPDSAMELVTHSLRGPTYAALFVLLRSLWGAWVSAYPSALFHLAGVAPINYPQIWQCVGMIVGVYGVGYLIAARDPVRHWPIVLVGLLGKVLGPIGMLISILKHDFPISMAWTCVTNDLIWWLPFGLILHHASSASLGKRSRSKSHFLRLTG